MNYKFDNERPIYTQIIDIIKNDIVNGKYKVKEKIPTVRELAMIYNVNPNTVQRAFSELEREKFVKSERTTGRYVTEDYRLIKEAKEYLINEKIESLFSYMSSIGVNEEEVINIINQRKRRK